MVNLATSVLPKTDISLTRTSMILGILYLSFQAFPVIFAEQRGFSTQLTGLTFCGIGLGMLIGLSTQPYWNRSGTTLFKLTFNIY